MTPHFDAIVCHAAGSVGPPRIGRWCSAEGRAALLMRAPIAEAVMGWGDRLSRLRIDSAKSPSTSFRDATASSRSGE